MAAVVCTLARVSNHLPISTNVITTAEPSKYRDTGSPGEARHHNQVDKAQPAVVPSATKTSMPALPLVIACHVPR